MQGHSLLSELLRGFERHRPPGPDLFLTKEVLKKFLSFWGDLNPWPLPYQGSALPLSYKSIVLRTKKRLAKVIYWMFSLIASMMLLMERKTRFELATYSLEGYRSTSWATSAFVFVFTSKTGPNWSTFSDSNCGGGWIRTTEDISQQIYSLPHLATLVHPQTTFQHKRENRLFHNLESQNYTHFLDSQILLKKN